MKKLNEIIALGEGFTTEFKRSGTGHLGRELCAFANVQIYIFEDRVEIVSPGGLPAGMTPELLGIKSIPRNPLLFGMLYRMDAVEQVGSGVRRIREICRDYGVAEPDYEISDHWVTMTFVRPKLVDGVRVKDEEPGPESGPESESIRDRILMVLAEAPMSRSQIAEALGHKSVSGKLKLRIKELMAERLIEYTIPEKPNSRLQKYKLTNNGKTRL